MGTRTGTLLAARIDDPILATRVAGIDFANPVGLAAGVDKDAEAIRGFLALGFGSVEVGTLTPRAQAGNPKPRLFRLIEDSAVINRMGFNNHGIDAALARIPARCAGVLGVNVGANKDSVDRVADYATGVAVAARLADYVTINVSSPNTPGLRDLQHGAALEELLAASREAAGRVPVFLKIAPDLDTATIGSIARAAIDHRIDALIVGNTTVSRPGLHSAHRDESGGLSGAPLTDLARRTLADFRSATERKDTADRGWRDRLGGGSLCPHPRRREPDPALHRNGLPRAGPARADRPRAGGAVTT